MTDYNVTSHWVKRLDEYRIFLKTIEGEQSRALWVLARPFDSLQ